VEFQFALVNVGQSVNGVRGSCDADIDLDGAWGIQQGVMGTVAVIGGGVWQSHPDLVGRVSGDQGASATNTPQAGIIAANTDNSEGVVGMDRQTQIVALAVDETDDITIVQQLQIAANRGVRVFDNAFRVRDASFNNRFSPTVRIAFRDLYMDNHVAVAAMGSTANPSTNYPAGFGQGLIAVGSTTQFDLRRSNSNSGSHIDVVAPGENLRVTSFVGGDYPLVGGTGPSAAYVAGLASLLLAEKSHLANDDIEQIIRITANDIESPGWDVLSGTGRINAQSALTLIQLPNRLYQLTANGNS
jgi:hypothetical protein